MGSETWKLAFESLQTGEGYTRAVNDDEGAELKDTLRRTPGDEVAEGVAASDEEERLAVAAKIMQRGECINGV